MKNAFRRTLTSSISTDKKFENSVRRIIPWMSKWAYLDDEELIERMGDELTRQEARDVVQFVPAIIAQWLLPDLPWPPYFIERTTNGKENEITYAGYAPFQQIRLITLEFCVAQPDQRTLVSMASRNPVFQIMNYLNEEGVVLSDLKVPPLFRKSSRT